MAVQPLNGDQEVPFGGYILLRRLAVGGMAEIFLARERGAGPEEFIVIKRLLGHISEHPGLVQMFLDEARVAATLTHPNIVKIFNVGTVGGHFFLSMEHLRGLDLSKLNREMRRQKRKLPIEQVLYICHRICKALAYAHDHVGRKGERLNIVHRDLSPHNVFLTLEGHIKLLDFGVAKAANALHKTKTGALIGKLAYMSPEHLNNDMAIDGRSDLFSLGIIMWELSVGRRLYNTKKLGEFEVLRRITQEPVPDPSQFRDDYPQVVKEVLDRALRKDRDDRYQTADAFANGIEAAANALGYDLSGEGMAEFVSSSLPEVVERITSSIRRFERSASHPVSSAPYTPSMISSPGLSGKSSTQARHPSPTSTPTGHPSQSSTPTGQPITPTGHPSQSSTPITGSSLSRPIPTSPREVVSILDEDEDERTERRVRRIQRVTWNQLPQVSPAPPPPKPRPVLLPIIVLVVLALGVVVGLFILLGS